MTQSLIAELFAVSRSTITDHINNIFKTNELDEKTSVGISDESTGGRKAKLYNLDVIIAVGYRVNSKQATNFRIWATKVLKDLNRIVTMYLDYAEMQAENHNAMTMSDWIEKLNAFFKFNGREILHGAVKISHEVAKELAYKEYDKFKIEQDKKYVSDFDIFMNEINKLDN